MEPEVPPGMLDEARRWSNLVLAEGLATITLVVDPEGKEIRLLVIADEFGGVVAGKAVPFRFPAREGSAYDCVVLALDSGEWSRLREGEFPWPEGWGSSPDLVSLRVRPLGAGTRTQRIRRAFKALGFAKNEVTLKALGWGRHSVRVVSPRFEGHTMVRRQDYLLLGLRTMLSSDDLNSIQAITTLTPDEMAGG